MEGVCGYGLAKYIQRKKELTVLDESSILFIVPETQAVLCGRTNSNPSLDTRVTNSSVDEFVGMPQVCCFLQ